MLDLFALGLALPPKVVNLLTAVVGIGTLVFLHELGHFLAAKYMGMPVETFSIGFGKRLVGFAWKETDVRLSLLPLGGYVKLAGFNPEEPGAEDPHGFLLQPYWKRMLFYSGGIIANLIVAFVLFWSVGQHESRIVKSRDAILANVQDGAAKDAGLQSGDEILAVGPHAVSVQAIQEGSWAKDIIPFVESQAGRTFSIRFLRHGSLQEVQVTPKLEKGVGKIGLGLDPQRLVLEMRPFRTSDTWSAARYSSERITQLSSLVFRFLKKLVTFKASSSEVGGPLTITRQMSQAASQGVEAFLFFCGAISLQLAILNALPIPMLDGGHMILLTVERLRRKDLSMELKERILTGGFFLLAGLMALVFILDLLQLKK